MPRHNHHFPVANPLVTNASTVDGGVTYLPGGTQYFANPAWQELRLYAQRLAAGSGTLIVSIEEFEPTLGIFMEARGGATAMAFVTWAAGVGNTATTRQLLRLGHGILGADADGDLVVNTVDHWYDYAPPQYWRLKLVESATGSTVKIGAQYLRGI